jgi:glucose-6-phosphate isomerase
MLPTVNFTETAAYKYLADHFIDINKKSIKDLFTEDEARFDKFSLLFEDILVDYSHYLSNWPENAN